jgi:hypothetical protein
VTLLTSFAKPSTCNLAQLLILGSTPAPSNIITGIGSQPPDLNITRIPPARFPFRFLKKPWEIRNLLRIAGIGSQPPDLNITRIPPARFPFRFLKKPWEIRNLLRIAGIGSQPPDLNITRIPLTPKSEASTHAKQLDLRFKGMKIKACQAFTQNNISLFVFSKNSGKSANCLELLASAHSHQI